MSPRRVVVPSGLREPPRILRAYEFGRSGNAEVSDYEVEDRTTRTRTPLAGATWAEWDQRGRLVFARDGQLYATSPAEPTGEAAMRADFNDHRPYDLAAPDWAREWSV